VVFDLAFADAVEADNRQSQKDTGEDAGAAECGGKWEAT
jgi:hypothetical protein